MNTILRSLFFFIFIVISLPSLAQQDTTLRVPGLRDDDSVFVTKKGKVITIEAFAARYDPRRAILLAAILPGSGQIYNKKYWKVPLVVGGFVGIGVAINFNQSNYLKYRRAVFSLLSEPANPVIVDPVNQTTALGNKLVGTTLYYPVDNLGRAVTIERARQAVNQYRRDRDFSLIMCFLFYMMQMVDAHVDAHLKEFDLNPQLKVSLEPTVNQNAFVGRSTGLGLTFKF